MERVVVNRAAYLSRTFYSAAGVATDPDSAPTVAITRYDGTAVTTGAVVNETAAGTWSVTIPPAENDALDTLTVTWTATMSAAVEEYVDFVEVVGGVVFTVAEARAALGDASYDAAKIVAARTRAEIALENTLRYALVPRFGVKTVPRWSAMPVHLAAYLRTIRSVTVGTVAYSPAQIAAVKVTPTGSVYSLPISLSVDPVTFSFEHGLDGPPSDAADYALTIALEDLGYTSSGGSIDSRAESIVTIDGTLRLTQGGQFGRVAGINDWITANRLPLVG